MMQRLSKRKKFAFIVVIILLGIFFLEVASRLTVPAFMGRTFSIEFFKIKQRDLAVDGQERSNAQEVLHPYFGWTLDPLTNEGTEVAGKHFKVNNFGFYDNDSSLVKENKDQITIAILGGSFAMEFALFSGDLLIQHLKKSPEFRDKTIQVIRLGMAGFKQPQQLMVLNYLLAIGADYDYVINLDGFNEGVLPAADNVHGAMHIAHPYRWDARLRDVVDPQMHSVSFQLHEIRATRQRLAQSVERSWFQFLYLRQLQWKLQDSVYEMKLMKLTEEHVRKNLTQKQYAVSGPANTYKNDQELYQSMAEIWKNSSWQMHLICKGKGIRYLHFLQPNQYVPDSKPLSELESSDFYVNEDHDFRVAVKECYPMLQSRGNDLLNQGVKFIDLTSIYQDEEQTIYRDWCCHVNKTGYDLVAKAISQNIAE